MLGKITVNGFVPQTAKSGSEMTKRKEKLRNAFEQQNDLSQTIKACKDKESLLMKVIFNLNENVENKTSYKKDLDNLLKVLLDVLPEEMDDATKAKGLGIIRGNEDERVREIHCTKNFVQTPDDEGIIVEFYEYQKH